MAFSGMSCSKVAMARGGSDVIRMLKKAISHSS
jgi:hypothetical protein